MIDPVLGLVLSIVGAAVGLHCIVAAIRLPDLALVLLSAFVLVMSVLGIAGNISRLLGHL